VPAGFEDGLHVVLDIDARRFDETTLLRAAHTFQEATDWHDRRPAIVTGARA
jgi:aspartyl-tRNA(Asn)/glutamyl-tRNA(Gln) amidotransferase subunit A